MAKKPTAKKSRAMEVNFPEPGLACACGEKVPLDITQFDMEETPETITTYFSGECSGCGTVYHIKRLVGMVESSGTTTPDEELTLE